MRRACLIAAATSLMLAVPAVAPARAQTGPASVPGVTQAPGAQTSGAQALVDRFAREPWRFEGWSAGLASLGQMPGWGGQKPARVLVGLAPQGDAISGEVVVLDAADRPLAFAPVSGRFTERPTPGQASAACTLRVSTPRAVTLRGICGPQILAGAYGMKEESFSWLVIAPGLAEPPLSEGTYWLTPWRQTPPAGLLAQAAP